VDWRWVWFWSLLWNAFVHAVTFNWSELSRDGDKLKEWWASLWGEISNQIGGVKNWAQDKVNYLAGYAYGLYISVRNEAWSWVLDARDRVTAKATEIYNYIAGRVSYLISYAQSLYNQAVSYARTVYDSLYAWARPYIDTAVNAVRSLYTWVQPYRDLITSWLATAKGAIDWLRTQAINQLQAFLRDPLGYVLGLLFSPLRDWINFYNQFGTLLKTFVANELRDWSTTWANGKKVLKAFLDDPEKFVLDIVAPRLIDLLVDELTKRW
jgi:hypothetical protein